MYFFENIPHYIFELTVESIFKFRLYAILHKQRKGQNEIFNNIISYLRKKIEVN